MISKLLGETSEVAWTTIQARKSIALKELTKRGQPADVCTKLNHGLKSMTNRQMHQGFPKEAIHVGGRNALVTNSPFYP